MAVASTGWWEEWLGPPVAQAWPRAATADRRCRHCREQATAMVLLILDNPIVVAVLADKEQE